VGRAHLESVLADNIRISPVLFFSSWLMLCTFLAHCDNGWEEGAELNGGVDKRNERVMR